MILLLCVHPAKARGRRTHVDITHQSWIRIATPGCRAAVTVEMDTSTSWLAQTLPRLNHSIYDVRRRAVQSLSHRLDSGLLSVDAAGSSAKALSEALVLCIQTFDPRCGRMADEPTILDIRRLLHDALCILVHVCASPACVESLLHCGVTGALESVILRAQLGGSEGLIVPPSSAGVAARLLDLLSGSPTAASLKFNASHPDNTDAEPAARGDTPWDVLLPVRTGTRHMLSSMAETEEPQGQSQRGLTGLEEPGAMRSTTRSAPGLPDVGLATARVTVNLAWESKRQNLNRDTSVVPDGPVMGAVTPGIASITGQLLDPAASSHEGWIFPWVALTRSDEQRLIDLLLGLKAATLALKGKAEASETGEQYGRRHVSSGSPPGGDTSTVTPRTAHGHADASADTFTGRIPERSPDAAPLVAVTRLFLRDFPAEVLLSAPGILAHMVAPIATPFPPQQAAALDAKRRTGPGATLLSNRRPTPTSQRCDDEPMVSAAATALEALFASLHSSLRARLDPAMCLVTGSHDDIQAHDAAVAIARTESRAAVRDYASGVGASASLPASSVTRFRMRQSMRSDGTGSAMEKGPLEDDGFEASLRSAATLATGDSRFGLPSDGAPSLSGGGGAAILAAAAAKWSFLPTAAPAQKANTERYYSLRFRLPGLMSAAGPHEHESTAAVGGLSTLLAPGAAGIGRSRSGHGDAVLLDSPVPVSRFAGVVVEACLVGAMHASRLSALLPVLRQAVPLLVDPCLWAERGGPLSGDYAAVAQRCIDAGEDALKALLHGVRTALHNTVWYNTSRTEGGIMLSHADGAHSRTQLDADVIGYAQLFDSACACTEEAGWLPVGLQPLLSAMFFLLSSLPPHALRQGEQAELEFSSSGGTGRVTEADKVRIRRAALARAHCTVVVPTTLLAILAGAASCASFSGVHGHQLVWLRHLLPALLQLEPSLADSMSSGTDVVFDLGTLRRALAASHAAAKSAPSQTESGGVLSPAAYAWKAFTVSFEQERRTHAATAISARALQEMQGHSMAHDTVRRVARVLMYVEQPKQVNEACMLAVTAACAYHDDQSGSASRAAVELLHMLAQHPRPAVREALYAACSEIVRLVLMEAGLSWALHLLGPGVEGQSSVVAGGLPPALPAPNMLHIACMTGLLDIDGAVATAAANFVCMSARGLSLLLSSSAKEGDNALRAVVASAIVEDSAGVLREAVGLMETRGTSTAPVQSLLEMVRQSSATLDIPPPVSLHETLLGLFSSEESCRRISASSLLARVCGVREAGIIARAMPADLMASLPGDAPAVLSLVARTQAFARQATDAQLRVTPAHLMTDPVAYLTDAYGRGDRLPLHPVTYCSPLAQPTTAAGLALNPAPLAMHEMMQRSVEGTRGTRFESAVALSNGALCQLETILASSLSAADAVRTAVRDEASLATMAPVLPWAVRIATAEQLSHALLADSPVPIHVQHRLVDTLDVLKRAIRAAEDSAGGSDKPVGSSFATWDDDRNRFIAAAAVTLDAVTAVSRPARDAVWCDPELQCLLAELLFLGPVVTVTAMSIDQSMQSSTALPYNGPQLVDARLCGARCIARAMFEESRGLGMPNASASTAKAAGSLGCASLEAIAVRPMHHEEDDIADREVDKPFVIRSARAEVLVDAITWQARPLLRTAAIAGGPAALHPALRILPLPAAIFRKDVPNDVSRFIVASAVDEATRTGLTAGNTDAPCASSGKAQALHPSSASAVSAHGLPTILRAQAMVAHASSADSHVTAVQRIGALTSACKADPDLCRAVGSLAFPCPSIAGESGRMLPIAGVLMTFLSTAPATDADGVVLGKVLSLLGTVLPFMPTVQRKELLALSMTNLLPLLSLTDAEACVGGRITAMHVQHASGQGAAQLGLRTTDLGRAELLVDSLRPSEYDGLANGYSLDPFGSNGHAAVAPATASAQYEEDGLPPAHRNGVAGLQRSPFSAGRIAVVLGVIGFFTDLCQMSASMEDAISGKDDHCRPGKGDEDSDGDGQLSLAQSISADACADAACSFASEHGCLPHVVRQMSHPHADSSVRFSCAKLLKTIFRHAVAIRTLTGVRSDVPIELCTPPVMITLVECISALLRVSASHRGSDSLQNKGAVVQSSRALAVLAQGAAGWLHDEAPAHANAVLSPLVWTDAATGTLAWLGRIAVDRDCRVRTCAYSIIASLIKGPMGMSHLSSDPGLQELLPVCFRHATTSVIACVTHDTGLLGRAVVNASSHGDCWDAEAECVRGACALAVEAHVLALVRTGTIIEGEGSEPSLLQDTLQRIDFVGRMRIALAAFHTGNELVPTHAGAVLACLVAAGSSSPATLHSVLSDAQARAGLLYACTVASSLQQGGGADAWSRVHAQGLGKDTTREGMRTGTDDPSLSCTEQASRATVSSHGSYGRACAHACANAFHLLRMYLRAHDAAHLPLRLRRHHCAPFIPALLATIVGATTTPADARAITRQCAAQREACLALTASIEAWSSCCTHSDAAPDLSGHTASLAHPLQEIVDSSGWNSRIPAGDGDASSRAVPDTPSGRASLHLRMLVPRLAALVGGSSAPLDLRVAASILAGTLTSSLAGVRLDQSAGIFHDHCGYATFISTDTGARVRVSGICALSRSVCDLLLLLGKKCEEGQVAVAVEEEGEEEGRDCDDDEGPRTVAGGQGMHAGDGDGDANPDAGVAEVDAEPVGIPEGCTGVPAQEQETRALDDSLSSLPSHVNPYPSSSTATMSVAVSAIDLDRRGSRGSGVVNVTGSVVYRGLGKGTVRGSVSRLAQPSASRLPARAALAWTPIPLPSPPSPSPSVLEKKSARAVPRARAIASVARTARSEAHENLTSTAAGRVDGSEAQTASLRSAGITPALLNRLGLSSAQFPVHDLIRQAREVGIASAKAAQRVGPTGGLARVGGGFAVAASLPGPITSAGQSAAAAAVTLMHLYAVRSAVAASAAALFECNVPIALPVPVAAANAGNGTPHHRATAIGLAPAYMLQTIGRAASDEMAIERDSPSPLRLFLESLLKTSHSVTLADKALVSDAMTPLQALLTCSAALADTLPLLQALTAAVFPHPLPAPTAQSPSKHGSALPALPHSARRRQLLVATADLRLGAILSHILSSAACLCRIARSGMPAPDSMVAAAVDVAVAVCAVGTNYAGCGPDSASELSAHLPQGMGRMNRAAQLFPSSNASLMDIMMAEAVLVAEVIVGSPRPSTGPAALPTSVGLISGVITADSSPGRGKAPVSADVSGSGLGGVGSWTCVLHPGAASTMQLVRLHESLFTCIMAAAHLSSGTRQLLLSRGVVTTLSAALARRLLPAERSGAAVLALPLPAIATQLRMIAAVSTSGDGPACAEVLRTQRLLDAAIAAVRMRIPDRLPLPSGSNAVLQASFAVDNDPFTRHDGAPSRRETLDRQLAEVRIAAMTLLSNLATRKGNEDAWISRPGLADVTVTCIEDPIVGVRCAAAAAVWALCKNTVRVRAILLAAAGGVGLAALEGALDENASLAHRFRLHAASSGHSQEAEAAGLLAQAAQRLQETLALLRV